MIGLVVIGSVCLTLGLLYLLEASRRRDDRRSHLLFGLVALAAAANAFIEPWAYRSITVEQYSVALKSQVAVQILWWILLTCFLVSYSGIAWRGLALVSLVLLGLAAVIHLASPHGILFSDIESLSWFELPWGETYALALGRTHPLAWVGYAAILALMMLAFNTCVRLWRAGQKRPAQLLGASLAALIAAMIHGVLVDLLIVRTPYLMSVAFLGFVLVTGFALAMEAAQASELETEVAQREKRWRTLLEEVHLLVAGIDREGRIDYTNPEFQRVTGYAAEDIVGRPVQEILSVGNRADVSKLLEGALSRGDLQSEVQAELITKDGNRRTVIWSNVLISGSNHSPAAILSIGADVTDQLLAESARDRALAEVQELKRQLERENLYLKEEIRVERGFSEMVGASRPLMYVLHKIEQVAKTDATVLIEGETGVGKELVGRAIHRASNRSARAFVTVNCAALPENLIESELFGHERGAFSGADRQRHGRFEVADGGTLLLDEIGDLPLDLQTKLLRVLEEGEFQRVGSSKTRRADVRVIASTNRDLQAEVDAGRFREDLFYRLNVYPITVPPLRDRPGDVALLVRHFVSGSALRLGKPIAEVPASVINELEAYDWPGNVRELKNVLERAVIVSAGESLRLPEPLGESSSSGSRAGGPDRPQTLVENERRHIQAVLDATEGQVAGDGGAARILGLPASTLRSRMKKLGIKVEQQGS